MKNTMKKFLCVMAGIWGVAAIVLYFTSEIKLDKDSVAILGMDSVINIQATIFCAACAILCGVNVVGALIFTLLEKIHNVVYEKEEVIFCDNCGIRKQPEELTTVSVKTRKGLKEKHVCQKCIAEMREKIVA